MPITTEQPGPNDNLDVFNCALSYECTLNWTDLAPTEVGNVRHCGTCDQRVTLCSDLHEFMDCAREGVCVAFYTAPGTEAVVLDTRNMRMGIPRNSA